MAITRKARIKKYLGNGLVSVVLDDGSDPSSKNSEYTVDLSIAYCTPDGAIIAGYPEKQTPILLEQVQGGWNISNFAKPDRVFNDSSSGEAGVFSNFMADFRPNRILLQSKKASNRIYLEAPSDDDPRGNNEISLGSALSSLDLDIKRDIINHDFYNEYKFTSANREILGTIKRDIQENSLRNIEGSVLYDNNYDDNLWVVGMDPSASPSPVTSGNIIRNLSLAESRKIIYEFENIGEGQNFEADNIEISKLDSNYKRIKSKEVQRNESRAVSFGLNLYYPNHLFEEVLGTGVDSFGNILDLNRAILPLGKGDLSLNDNASSKDAFSKIRNVHRKAIAYHFEINTRKENGAIQKVIRGDDGIPEIKESEGSIPGAYEVLSVEDFDNYARDRSRFFFDVDKEGQFKLNVPMSSETGNIPLHTRYVNSSVLAFSNDDINSPNDFLLEDQGVDIYLENYTFNPVTNGVTLKGEEGDIGPIDRKSGKAMKLNVVYHDITQAGYQFTKKRLEDDEGNLLVRYQPDSSINKRQLDIQLDKIITSEINISGSNANAGGRSGTINLDGFLSWSIGANTVDRQSLWLDTAGGIISTIGRDRRGVSYLGNYDGDVLMQIGGKTIDTNPDKIKDTRFAKENDTAQSGVLDIRVIKSDGQMTIVRIDESGVSIATQGRFEVMSEQDIVFNSNSNILFDAPNIGFFYKNAPKFIERNQIRNI